MNPVDANATLQGRVAAGGHILAAILQGWHNRGSARWWLLLLAVALLGLPGLVLALADARAARTTLLLCLAFCHLGVWIALIYGLMVQNTAATARLVPGHVQRLREVLAAAWCLGLAGVAGVAWLHGSSVLATTTILAVLMVWAALMVRWPLLALALLFVPPWLGLRLGPWLRRAAEGLGDGYTVPAALLAVALLAWLLGGLFGTGGHSHARRLARLVAWRRSIDEGRGVPHQASAALVWISRACSWPYARALASLARAPATAVWPRLMLVFGPASHWQVHAAWMLLLASVAAAVVVWMVGAGHVGGGRTLGWPQVLGPVIGFASASISPVLGALNAAVRSRREQALVALLPGAPRGAALNRGLVWRWLWHFGAAWLFMAAVTLGLTSLMAPALQPLLLAALVGLWPLAAVLCADVSRLSVQSAAPMQWAVGGLFVGPALTGAAHELLAWPVAGIAAGVGLGTLGWLAWRWRGLARRPGAFPACRLA